MGETEDVLAATIEPPEPSRVVSAMQTLHMLGALDEDMNLTSLGRVLVQIPVDAAIGKLCLFGSFFRCLDSALTLAAVMTSRDPFLAPIDLRAEAKSVKDSWSPLAFRSDALATVAAYNRWAEFDDRRDYARGTSFCSDNFLSKPTLLQIKQVKKSLLQSLQQAGVIAVSAGGAVGSYGRLQTVPAVLNENGNSLSLLAALIAMASAPNFAIRISEKSLRTSQDKVRLFQQPSDVSLPPECLHPSELCQRQESRTGRPRSPVCVIQPGREASLRVLGKGSVCASGPGPQQGSNDAQRCHPTRSHDVYAFRCISARCHSKRIAVRSVATGDWQLACAG